MGEGLPQWLATGPLATGLECLPAVALLAGPGAPQPKKIKLFLSLWAVYRRLAEAFVLGPFYVPLWALTFCCCVPLGLSPSHVGRVFLFPFEE